MPTVKLLKRAELELTDACAWYEGQQKGLSVKLRNEIKRIINLMILNPELYASKYNTELHFAPLNKFPYIIVYWFDKNLNTLFITSVFHTKRNPQRF